MGVFDICYKITSSEVCGSDSVTIGQYKRGIFKQFSAKILPSN